MVAGIQEDFLALRLPHLCCSHVTEPVPLLGLPLGITLPVSAVYLCDPGIYAHLGRSGL